MHENDSILEMYLFESSMLLDQLDEILLQSEKNKNLSAENINEIFRIMHTIKGSSAMMEFEALSYVAHKLEDLFYYVRENGLDENYFAETMDMVLEVSDFFKEEVEKIREGQELKPENDSLVEKIINMLSNLKDGGLQSANTPTTTPSPKEHTIDFSVASKDMTATAGGYQEGNAKDKIEYYGEASTYNIHVRFTADSQMENVRAFMLVNKLETYGDILMTLPEELSADPNAAGIIKKDGFYCSLYSSAPLEEIEAAATSFSSVEHITFLDNVPGDLHDEQSSTNLDTSSDTASSGGNTATTQSTSPGDASANKSKDAKQNLIAVDLNKLDALMDLVGEIVITESMVSGSPDIQGLELENFDKAARQLGKLTDELQDIAMSIRMIPVSATFQKMNRIVRDMNKKLGRNVELIMMGEATEVDKTIIDGIVDPLMHLVRNAMDHGIEDADERRMSKKDPEGRIILSAQNAGGEIIITVSDDGRGLDAGYILEKARERNILSKAPEEYSEKEIFNLLTLPGFSTKKAVTEFSGRGVGMDVVKKSIEKIGGNITIESVKGVGTTVLFRIPLTLSIIPCMEVRVGEEIYAIPISNIRESFKPSVDQLINDPDGNEMIMIRGTVYPVIRMDRIYDIESTSEQMEDGVFMLVYSSERTACLFADEILGKHRVVVKPIPLYLNRFDLQSMGISGCTILGNGNISLILDVQGILNQY